MESLEDLLEQQKKIGEKISALLANSYTKYGMSEEVKNDNPYSRLMALKKMGVVENYETIKEKTILVVGVGGVGSVTCEMLTRCGVGKLIIYDYDKVELANMNRLFFTPTQVGLSKVEAAKQTLNLVNPEIVIEAYNMNITTQEGYDHLSDRITKGSLTGSRIDLVMSCVDNYAARGTINVVCNQLVQVWFESGVSEDALSSHIQVMIPGESGCFSCASPLAVVQGNEGGIKRQGVCAASLPTTMGITAGFLVQNALKYLLNFGEVSFCLTYNSRTDFFSNYLIRINPQCKQPSCHQAQKKVSERGGVGILQRLQNTKEQRKKAKGKVIHEQNEWGIEIVEEAVETKEIKGTEIAETQQSVDDLMNQLNNL